MRNKKTEIISLVFPTIIFLPLFCQAAIDVSGIIESVATTTKRIALASSTIIIIIGGFLIMTASGDPNAVERGKRTIFFGIIGIAIIAGAEFIANAIKSIAGL